MDKNPATLGNEFRQLLAGDFDLARAALLIARIEYPELDPQHSILRLDALASAVQARLHRRARAEDQVAMINTYLFAEQQYRGNDANYYDPRNSCLNAVLDRKIGIPLTLSLLYMEIGRRLGLNIEGIAFPGHFLVRVACKRGLIVLDPYNGGETLAEAELRLRLAHSRGADYAESAAIAEILVPASGKEILLRMLANLKQIYLQAGETDKAIVVITLALIVNPDAAIEWRDRGLLYRQVEAFRAALGDLSHYVALKPDAEDGEVVRHLLMELHAINARFN